MRDGNYKSADLNLREIAVLEIRAGAGGDEACLFAAKIFRMCLRYADAQKWRVEVTSSSDSAASGPRPKKLGDEGMAA